MGRDVDDTTQAIFLRPVLSSCELGQRCFKRYTPLTECDVSITISVVIRKRNIVIIWFNIFSLLHQAKSRDEPWGGCIVCLSASGWYPAAVYYDHKGVCGFQKAGGHTSLRYLTSTIIEAISKI